MIKTAGAHMTRSATKAMMASGVSMMSILQHRNAALVRGRWSEQDYEVAAQQLGGLCKGRNNRVCAKMKGILSTWDNTCYKIKF